MWRPGRPAMKVNEVYWLLPGLAGPLGSFVLDMLAPLGIVVWIGCAFSLWYLSHFSLEPPVFLPLVALACTGLIVAGYFRSFPATNAFYAAVNRTMGVSFFWIYTRLLMRTCAAGDKLRAAQKNLQYSETQFRVTADAALPLTSRHQRILQTYL